MTMTPLTPSQEALLKLWPYLTGLSETDRLASLALMEWRASRRANQTPPDGDWLVWLILAGRGFGKTRTGAEVTKERMLLNPGCRVAIVAPTFSDARDTCMEGESGLLNVMPDNLVATWNRSMGEFSLTNGSQAKLFSADEPDRLRGPQHHFSWCDELAAWRYPDAWDQLLFGLRLGDDPRVVVTTTPRPVPLVRSILADHKTRVTRGSTFDNAANLAPAILEKLREKYEGTRLGRQELFAEILDDVPGALWTWQMIEAAKLRGDLPELERVVVGVDPAISNNDDSDETGIVVAARGRDGRGYVLADVSLKGTPDEWAKAVCAASLGHNADRIVAEGNQGGEMVRAVIKTVMPNAPIKIVHASRGKYARAEPVAALYEQGKVSHVGGLAELEAQMTGYSPQIAKKSPDRMDALVWALTDLMLGNAAPEPSIRRL